MPIAPLRWFKGRATSPRTTGEGATGLRAWFDRSVCGALVGIVLACAGPALTRRYQAGERSNFSKVKQLQEQGRVQGLAEADYRPGAAAYLWLMDSMEQIATEIVENRRIAFAQIPNPPGHG